MKTNVIFNKLISFWRVKFIPFFKDPLMLSHWELPYRSKSGSNQISVRVNSSGYRWVGHNYAGDLYMFVEDMHKGIMPYSSVRRANFDFTARLEPANQELERIITEALDRQRHRHDLSDALSRFIRNTTHSLFLYGKATYELLYETDSNGKLIKFDFVHVHPLSINKLFDNYFQFIPWRVAKQSNVKVGIKRIPRNKILMIIFPRELGGRRSLIKILKRLSALSKEIIPGFQMDAMSNNIDIGFNLNDYTRTKYVEKAQLTSMLGWHQRKYQDNEILEYYSMYRHLRFARSQAIIREYILESINKALNGPLLNFNTRIVVEGLISSKQLVDEFKTLKRGGIEFSQLYKRTSL